MMALGIVLYAMGFGILSAAAATGAGFEFFGALAAYSLGAKATFAALLINALPPRSPPHR